MVKKSRILPAGLLALLLLPFAQPASALVGYADTVLEYYDSGAGPIAGPYGGTWNGVTGIYPIPISTSALLGDDPGYPPGVADFLSLPTGSYVTLGFTDETVIDGAGDDIFIEEVGPNGERADVYVSANLIDFVFLGTAIDDASTALDLASIGFTDPVQAIRIVGLDALGGSPGFDIINVQVLPGSIGAPPEATNGVPAPATLALLGLGLIGATLGRQRRSPAA